jgi:D-tyrosyl-tRNA(Tyr) deacylase
VRLLLQRVTRAEVRVGGEGVGRIGRGLMVLVGVGRDDDRATVEAMARKTTELRIFGDAEGRTNRSLADVSGDVLAVSQFTLYADTRKGRRPSLLAAAPPEQGGSIYAAYVAALRDLGVHVECGVFGAEMEVELVNDGPFTVWLDSAAP